MACNRELESRDLVPVFSFFILQGRCRRCGSALSIQYPLVEIATAVLFTLAYAFLPPVFSLWGLSAFASLLGFLATLVALTAYDLRHTLTPLPFIIALLVFAFLASVFQSLASTSFTPLVDSVFGGALLALFFFFLYAVTRGRGMGLGDAYVAGAIGVLLGLSRGIEAVMLAFWVGTLLVLSFWLLSSVIRRTAWGMAFERVTMKTELPFVPFLALGALLALFTDLSPLAAGSWLASVWFENF